MRVLVSGSHGLVGAALIDYLEGLGHEVGRLVRRRSGHSEQEVLWQPTEGEIECEALEAYDAVVHLAGENIAEGRWTEDKKTRIRESRVQGTTLLAQTLAQLENPPRVLVCASAIGYYGSRGDETLDESSAPGTGFLADVCKAWEAACEPARTAGIRVVNLRIGVVLSGEGGALTKMLLPFKLGLGGPLGDGSMYMSWITLDDLVRAIQHAIETPELEGPVNALAPEPVTNRTFTKTLGRVLRRPTILPVPSFALKAAAGEMANEMLLVSVRAVPNKLTSTGFEFRHPDLEQALRHCLQSA